MPKRITTDRPVFTNDVVAPLTLFKVFLDSLVANKGFEPMTEQELVCLDGGAIALTSAIADMRTLNNYINELEGAVRRLEAGR